MIVLIRGQLATITSFCGTADGSLSISSISVKDVEVLPGNYRQFSDDVKYLSRYIPKLSRDN